MLKPNTLWNDTVKDQQVWFFSIMNISHEQQCTSNTHWNYIVGTVKQQYADNFQKALIYSQMILKGAKNVLSACVIIYLIVCQCIFTPQTPDNSLQDLKLV